LLGMNRGRYFLLTGQTLDAADALRLGLVAEVLPADKLLARAWELAEDLVRKPTLLLRYTRLLFTEYLRRQMHDLLGYGLARECPGRGRRSRRRAGARSDRRRSRSPRGEADCPRRPA